MGRRILKREWRWTAQREAVAFALWEGKTYSEVQQVFGLSSATIAAWKKEPEFAARLDELDDEVTGEARRLLRRAGTRAAAKVVDIMEFGTPRHTTRLAAAKDILDRVGLKAPEKHDITFSQATAANLPDEVLEAELRKRGLE